MRTQERGDFTTRDEIIDLIFQNGHGRYTKVKTKEVLTAFFEYAARELQNPGNSVRVPGFGVFSTRQVGKRKGRNIVTNEAMEIPPATRVVFKPSKKLKNILNKTGGENENDLC